MSTPTRALQYSLAINEALHQLMESDPNVLLLGQGVKSPWYVGNTCTGLLKKFGANRVIDTPVSENVSTGAAVGAAMAGMRPIVVHPRMDFMLYAFDPIVNQAANWHYMAGGNLSIPVVFWGIVNRGGEQGAQHSQSLHGLFAHIPGLKVVMPSTPYDAKGLMAAAVQDGNPVVFIDDRWLYSTSGEVPKELYTVPIGKGIKRVEGKDVTIVSVSFMMVEALVASETLRNQGISAEVIDLRTVKPWDSGLVLESVKKTRRLLVVDGGWHTCGFAAEVCATVSEELYGHLAGPIKRITLPDAPAPASRTLEKAYYPKADHISKAVHEILKFV
jgi:acetoin:2,6-dichlorophenolindophenol oxidoreductase subunit beta